MKEVFGDIWNYPEAHVICITTNGYIKRDLTAVMGRGVAYQATLKMPGIKEVLGRNIHLHGNHVQQIGVYSGADKIQYVYSFPVKHNWWEIADPELIRRSAKELHKIYFNEYSRTQSVFLLPRPGCNNGKLSWERTVRCILQEELPEDNFWIITNER